MYERDSQALRMIDALRASMILLCAILTIAQAAAAAQACAGPLASGCDDSRQAVAAESPAELEIEEHETAVTAGGGRGEADHRDRHRCSLAPARGVELTEDDPDPD